MCNIFLFPIRLQVCDVTPSAMCDMTSGYMRLQCYMTPSNSPHTHDMTPSESPSYLWHTFHICVCHDCVQFTFIFVTWLLAVCADLQTTHRHPRRMCAARPTRIRALFTTMYGTRKTARHGALPLSVYHIKRALYSTERALFSIKGAWCSINRALRYNNIWVSASLSPSTFGMCRQKSPLLCKRKPSFLSKDLYIRSREPCFR